ncbi:glycosyltransferase WbsX family protein [Flavobacterium ustbae]|uniref:glycosyltransferase WbsX family protein n=1 Tax=Flavobacterium ustbae TaxID=2488790 RepID=UPI000F7B59AA|nr:glycoside hydrolase family 99-like domain-containing protein [Flavobacterium ustbae]
MIKEARVIAFYLPQYHPIPENDEWWGKGFTEWTNVGKAKSLFKGHYQPRIPADLGYYDLRVPETRKAQADMAREYGVEGFCYWHYWFGNGKRLIERPFNEVVVSGEPDFPFCLAWANETWKGFAHGLKNRNVLIEQQYPGNKDYIAHFYEVLPAFKDKRYITIEDKPLFMIYKSLGNEEVKTFIDVWRRLALENGLKGIHFVGHTTEVSEMETIFSWGFDSVNVIRLHDYAKFGRGFYQRLKQKLLNIVLGLPRVYLYEEAMKYFNGPEDVQENVFPAIFPNWDHSPRSNKEASILHNSNPELFKKHVAKSVESVRKKSKENKVIFLKSWNEWAEGNHMEPDLKYGKKYLEALKEVLCK